MSKIVNFNKELEKNIKYIEEVIKKNLPRDNGYQKAIYEAMEYNMLAGGKRIRPMLALLTYELFAGKDKKLIEPFLVAIEMIHTYSLVHDDLPAMDNDDYRRGRKTTHIVYGEAMAILTGDALLNYAFEISSKALSTASIEQIRAVAKAYEILSKKAGIFGMIGGQVIDMNDTMDKDVNVEDEDRLKRLVTMYRLKTSALIEASMMIGATLAGASFEEVEKIEQLANDIGLAFQIRDDILDVTSSKDVLGKPVHSDERNEKVTYVSLCGMDKSIMEVEELSNRALSILNQIDGEKEFLTELIINLIKRDK